MGQKKEKAKSGEAVKYYSRKQALRYLQISLPHFTRLCLWTDIHPTVPNNLATAGKGDTRPKIYYKRKDIVLLLHEPIINQMRQLRAHSLQLKRAIERKDQDKVYRLRKCKPRIKLDQLAKKRFPTKMDALYHMSDCLRSIFIFAVLPKLSQFNVGLIHKCKQLKLEFMNYCIANQSVRKCYLSTKGCFISVEICGVDIIWLLPHQHCAGVLPTGCDIRMLADQVQFDIVVLMTLLSNLYGECGLVYPPQFSAITAAAESANGNSSDWSVHDILASLAFPSDNTASTDQEQALNEADQSALTQLQDIDPQLAVSIGKQQSITALKSLFKGKKFFLNREVPREFFCFLLRSCGAANVSWDSALGTGATFDVDDESIDYHVIDRPIAAGSERINRYYVQPQFICDSINAARLMPVKDYLPGMKLIPHLSPFVDYTKGYVPAEYRYLSGEIDAEQLYADVGDEEGDAIEEIDEEEEDIEELDEESDQEEEEVDVEAEQEPQIIPNKKSSKKQKPRINEQEYKAQAQANKEIKLKEMSLPRKRLNLYKKMKHAEKKEKATVENLKQKRQVVNRKRKMSVK